MKIAFLFLTIDNVIYPEIWEYYFKNNMDKINIYCHPKYPDNVTVPWQKKNIISNLVPTKWGFLTQAMVSLLKSSLKNKENLKFILVSDSCLPIKSFNLLFNFLKKDNLKTSYIDLYSEDIDVESSSNFKKSNLPPDFFSYKLRKHSQWFCLSRYHVKKLLIHPDLNKFKRIKAGDENILTLIINEKYIKNFDITFTNWDENKLKAEEIRKEIERIFIKKENEKSNKKKKYNKIINNLRKKRSLLGSHPKTYDKLNQDELNEIEESKSFFYRKFSKDSNIIIFYKNLL